MQDSYAGLAAFFVAAGAFAPLAVVAQPRSLAAAERVVRLRENHEER
jgi:hypothetical protein